jgi:hypothetical protein
MALETTWIPYRKVVTPDQAQCSNPLRFDLGYPDPRSRKLTMRHQSSPHAATVAVGCEIGIRTVSVFRPTMTTWVNRSRAPK